MSDTVEIAILVSAFGSLIAAVGGAVSAVIAARNGREIAHVKHQTDGLVKVLGDAKLAQGIAQGTATGLAQGRAEEKVP
jgi:hypothetical protein